MRFPSLPIIGRAVGPGPLLWLGLLCAASPAQALQWTEQMLPAVPTASAGVPSAALSLRLTAALAAVEDSAMPAPGVPSEATVPTVTAALPALAPEGVPHRRSVIAYLREALGQPYRRGAAGGNGGESGFDCSGLVQRAYSAAGLSLPRVTYEQIRAGQAVAATDVRPGDLLFYRWDEGGKRPLHVVVYVGEGRGIHASVGYRVVREVNLRAAVWQRHFVAAVRMI